MSDKIIIYGVSAKGFHGVLGSEQRKGQKFIVDVELTLNLNKLNDDLNKTVNYADVVELINNHITGKTVLLIETLAENIGKDILRKYKKTSNVLVRVHKPKAPIAFRFKDIVVQIEIKK
jgi:dihydroneopterin aldolase